MVYMNNYEASKPHFRIDWRELTFERKQTNFTALPSRGKRKLQPQNANPRVKRILNSIDGHLLSGQLSAILGPSGAGKSTLLSSLFGSKKRYAFGRTKVTWFADDKHTNPIAINRVLKISYLTQQDYLIDRLTVYESLMFASKLKNPSLITSNLLTTSLRDITSASSYNLLTTGRRASGASRASKVAPDQSTDDVHIKNIKRIVKLLKLEDCLHTRCHKLSGGQYKRVTIAQELLSKPDIIVLDEPTTGLDAFTCETTIKTLKSMIKKQHPICIVLTIHQPDVDVLNLFDRVYVLAQGGQAIYNGPPAGIMPTLESIGYQLPDEESELECNPARVIVQLAIVDEQWEQLERQQNDENEYLETQALTITTQFHSDNVDAICQARGRQQSRVASQAEIRAKLCAIQKSQYAKPTVKHKTSLGSLHRFYAMNVTKSLDRIYTSLTVAHSDTHNQQPVVEDNSNRHSDANEVSYVRQFDQQLTTGDSTSGQQGKHFWHNLRVLAHRSWLCLRRDPLLCFFQAFIHVSVAMIFSLLFKQEQDDACPRIEQYGSTRDNIRSIRLSLTNINLIYMESFMTCCIAGTLTAMVFPFEMKNLLKEARNGWYSLAEYFLAKTLAELPLQSLIWSSAALLFFYLTNQPLSLGQQLMMLLIVNVSAFIAQSIGYTMGSIFMSSFQSSIMSTCSILVTMSMFCGTIVRVDRQPHWAQWLSYVNFHYYTVQAFVGVRYGFGRCPCDEQHLFGGGGLQQHNNSNEVPMGDGLAATSTMAYTSTSMSTVSVSSKQKKYLKLANFWLKTLSQNNEDDPIIRDAAEFNLTQADLSSLSHEQEPRNMDKIFDILERANTFGVDMRSCAQVKPFAMYEYRVRDEDLLVYIMILIAMFVLSRLVAFAVIWIRIRISL